MTEPTGSLIIAARRSGAATVLERVRYDGISRCSRAFREGDAARIVLSQLGPGVMRGDAVRLDGWVRPAAHLIVTSQTATRLLGGAARASSHARWHVAPDGILELLGEPLVASADAKYVATTTIALTAGALAIVSDIAGVPADADVRISTSVVRDDRELFYDAFRPAAAAPDAVGTLAVIGLDRERADALVSALDPAADELLDCRIGIGGLPDGILVRILAPIPWTVRSALITLRRAVWHAVSRNASLV